MRVNLHYFSILLRDHPYLWVVLIALAFLLLVPLVRALYLQLRNDPAETAKSLSKRIASWAVLGALLFGVAGMLKQLDVTAFLASSLRRIFFN